MNALLLLLMGFWLPQAAAAKPAPFTTPLTPAEMKDKQAVIDTTAGTIVTLEFNDLPHLKGTLSMARGDDPASASTSFFICTAPAPGLDRVYTAFGRVVDGLTVVEAIEATPVVGEKPNEKIEIIRARVTGAGR